MDDYEVTEHFCEGLLLGNADLADSCQYAPPQSVERVPQETELPMALAFADYRR
jgi:hypothetical protein